MLPAFLQSVLGKPASVAADAPAPKSATTPTRGATGGATHSDAKDFESEPVKDGELDAAIFSVYPAAGVDVAALVSQLQHMVFKGHRVHIGEVKQEPLAFVRSTRNSRGVGRPRA